MAPPIKTPFPVADYADQNPTTMDILKQNEEQIELANEGLIPPKSMAEEIAPQLDELRASEVRQASLTPEDIFIPPSNPKEDDIASQYIQMAQARDNDSAIEEFKERMRARASTIAPNGRPMLPNADGSVSTEESITITDPRINGGAPTNIPSIWGGQRPPYNAGTPEAENWAVEKALESKQRFQSYRSIEDAVQAARQRSLELGKAIERGRLEQRSEVKKATDTINAMESLIAGKPIKSVTEAQSMTELFDIIMEHAQKTNWSDAPGAVAKDIGKGFFVEGVPQAVGGVNLAVKNTSRALAGLADWMTTNVGGEIPVPSTGNKKLDQAIQRPLDFITELLPGDEGIKKAETFTGIFIKEGARFLTGFIPLFRAGKAAGAGNITTSIAAGSLTDAITQTPEEPNLSNLIEKVPPLRNPVTEFLATDPNDPEALNRLRQGIEGAGMGVLTEGLLWGIRALANARKAVPELEAQRQLHGEVGDGTVVAATKDEPYTAVGGASAKNPFVLDLTSEVAREETERRLRAILTGQADGPVIKPSTRPLQDDSFGTRIEKEEVLGLIERKARPEEISAHPLIRRAMERQKRDLEAPQIRIEDITPEHRAQRKFDFNGEEVVGYDKAVPRLAANAEAYAGSNGAAANKEAIILLGPPAAGKTTIGDKLARELRYAVVDADDVKATLPEYAGGVGSTRVHPESTLINAMVLEELARSGKNMVIPKLGHGSEPIVALVQKLKELGYTVDVVNVRMDAEENYRRMISRFIHTGRLIEENYFKQIGDLPTQTYERLKREGLVREAANYDNSTAAPKRLEASERLAAAIERSGGGGDAASIGGAGARQAPPQIERLRQAAEPVYNDMLAQLRATGMKEEEALANAAVVAARYAARAERLGTGKTAMDLYKESGLRVERSDAPPSSERFIVNADEPMPFRPTKEQTLEQRRGWFGTGYWIKDGKLHKIEEGALGPHGDHDGWISIADNANKLGVDEKKSAAFQIATYNFADASKNKWVDKFFKKHPEYAQAADEGTPLQDFDFFDSDFKKFFGMEAHEALAWRPEGMFRMRKWPDGQLTIDNIDAIKDTRKFIEQVMAQEPELLNGVKRISVASAKDDSYIDLTVEQFLDGKWKGKGYSFEQRGAAPPFFSVIDRAVGGASFDKGSAGQWLGLLKNTAGVKQEEIKWRGIDKFLEDRKGQMVTKAEIEEWLRISEVKIKEIRKDNEKAGFIDEDEVMAEADRIYRRWSSGENVTADYREVEAGPNIAFEVIDNRGIVIERVYSPESARAIAEDFNRAINEQDFGALVDWSQIAAEQIAKSDAAEVTRHGTHILPGPNSKYREILLTLPDNDRVVPNPAKRVWWVDVPDSPAPAMAFSEEQVAQIRSRYPEGTNLQVREENFTGVDVADSGGTFRVDDHWHEDNVLAHARVTERELGTGQKGYQWVNTGSGNKSQIFPSLEAANGYYWSLPDNLKSQIKLAHVEDRKVKTLFIEEIQSDWHQQGRERGYKEPNAKAEHERLTQAHKDLIPEINRVIEENDRLGFDTVHEARGALWRDGVERWEFSKPEDLEIAKKYVDALNALREFEAKKSDKAVPDAPFKKNWHELMLKRMIKLAADEGYDQIAWTTGKQQNDRWSLSRELKRIEYDEATKQLRATPKNGREELHWRDVDGERLKEIVGAEMARKILETQPSSVRQVAQIENDIVKYVREFTGDDNFTFPAANEPGKWSIITNLERNKPAMKRLVQEWQDASNGRLVGKRILEGEDLELGGQGMKSFYDRMLVNAANDLGKPHKAQVKQGEVVTGQSLETVFRGEAPTAAKLNEVVEDLLDKQSQGILTGFSRSEIKHIAIIADAMEGGKTFDQAMQVHGLGSTYALMQKVGYDVDMRPAVKTEPVHVLEITPELRRTAREDGFRLFQNPRGWEDAPGGPDYFGHPKGIIDIKSNEAVVKLFRTADASTFQHEAGHLFFFELMRDAAMDAAPKQLKDDLDTVFRWLGVQDGTQLTRAHHEQWAKGFERYLAEGSAPSPQLQSAFERFKTWLIEIYRSLTSIGDKEITDEVRGVMDRLLATDPELALAGKAPLVGPAGLTGDILGAVVPRLQEAGFDGLVTKSVGGKTRAMALPAQLAGRDKLGAAMEATETGVPSQVVAQGLVGSAEDAASRAGIARVLRTDDSPVGATGEGAIAPGPDVYVNFGRINEPDDVKQVIRDLADAFKGEINEARRGVQSNEETIRLADRLGMGVDELLQRQKGQPFNAEQALAARRLLNTSAEQLLGFAEKAALPTATLADQYNFRRMLAVHQAIQTEVIAARTETARALQSWAIPAGGNVEMARNIQQLIDGAGGAKVTQELAKRMAILKAQGLPPAAIDTMVKRSWAAVSMDMVKEAFVLGLLWNPKTHVANFASNLVTAAQQVYERSAARAIGDLLGTAVSGSRVVDGEAIAMMYGWVTSLKDAFRLAGRAAVYGETGQAIPGSKMDERIGAISSRHIAESRGYSAVETQQFVSSTAGRAIDFMGTVVRLPGNALAAGDEFFKTIGYRMELHAHSLRQATDEGYTGPDLWKRMMEIVNDPPEHIRIAAADAALYATFQSKMGEIGTAISMARNAGSYNPTFAVLPFVKTPTNILRYTFERTPLAFLVKRWRDDIDAGGARRDLALARMSTGTAIMAVAMDFAANGQITGTGPRERGRKEALMRDGWQPSSALVDGKYYSFNRGDPLAMPFTVMGQVAEIMRSKDLAPEDFDQLQEIMGAAIGIMSTTVVDKTYFQGISQIIMAIESSEKGSQAAANWMNRQVGGFVPFSSAQGVVKQFTDPVQREVNSMWDGIQNRLFWMSENLPPVRDLWGEERKPEEVFGKAYDVLSPAQVTKQKGSPIDQEIIRLGGSIERIKKKGEFMGADVNFYEWPKVYDEYVRLAGNELKHPAWGVGLKDLLNQVVSGKHELSEVYNFMSNGPEGGKMAWLKNQVSAYRRLAQQEIMNSDKFPEFVNYVNTRRQQRQELKMPPEILEQMRQ